MFFKENDILVLKDSVTPNKAYDGVFIDSDTMDDLKGLNIVHSITQLVRNDRDTQYVTLGDNDFDKFPSSIFNKIGEALDEPVKNDTHYFRSKKTYDSYEDYLLDN